MVHVLISILVFFAERYSLILIALVCHTSKAFNDSSVHDIYSSVMNMLSFNVERTMRMQRTLAQS